MPSEYMMRARALMLLGVLLLLAAFMPEAFADEVYVCSTATSGEAWYYCDGYVETTDVVVPIPIDVCAGTSLSSGVSSDDCASAGGSWLYRMSNELLSNDLVFINKPGNYGFLYAVEDLVFGDPSVTGGGSSSSSSSSSSSASQDSGVGPFPVLSESDGYQIAYAVLLLWGVAYGLLQIRRALKR